jgi:hypothetical protein
MTSIANSLPANPASADRHLVEAGSQPFLEKAEVAHQLEQVLEGAERNPLILSSVLRVIALPSLE